MNGKYPYDHTELIESLCGNAAVDGTTGIFIVALILVV
jgi:hypothetical protein